MGVVVGFVSKSDLERLRLIREARAIYDSIFPPTDGIDERSDDRDGKDDASAETPSPSKVTIRIRITGTHPLAL
jgi:hypothetical protein